MINHPNRSKKGELVTKSRAKCAWRPLSVTQWASRTAISLLAFLLFCVRSKSD
jgi:hypothetical protein